MGYEEYRECDILLNHIPPSKTLISTTQNHQDWGDFELYIALKHRIISPKHVLSGHVHKPQGNEDIIEKTRLSNPGVSAGNLPQFKIIPL